MYSGFAFVPASIGTILSGRWQTLAITGEMMLSNRNTQHTPCYVTAHVEETHDMVLDANVDLEASDYKDIGRIGADFTTAALLGN